MSTGTTAANWTLPLVGGAIVVGLQTPPDTAVSNAALWIEKITGNLPDFPPWADALGTAVGIIIAFTPLLLWLRKRLQSRNSGYKLTGRNLAGLERVMAGGGDDTEAFRKNELARKRVRRADLSNRPSEWIPFHRALYHLVYESRWGAKQPAVETEGEFNQVVCAEVRERLARGDIASRGHLGWDEGSRQRATQAIPAEYWIDAYFLPYAAIALGQSSGDEIAKQGGGGAVYRGVILRGPDVKNTWIGGRSPNDPLPPLATFVDGARAKIAAETQPPGSRGVLAAMDDELADQQERTWQRLGAILSPDKIQRVRAGKYRDASLADALGWIVYGEWGKPWRGTPVGAAFAAGLGIGDNPYDLMAEVGRRAGEGKLTIWGKLPREGVWKTIPASHWQDHQLTLADTFGSITTGENGYRDLMLNRAEIEGEWPHEG